MAITWSRRNLTVDSALIVLQAAMSAAADRSLADSVVRVDETRRVKASARIDGASDFTFQAATDKAFTAANTGMRTSMWGSIISGSAHVAVRLTSAINRMGTPPGGVPIVVADDVVRTVGVSGGADDDDIAVAERAVAAFGIRT